jgi:hypothetical protein
VADFSATLKLDSSSFKSSLYAFDLAEPLADFEKE